MADKDGRILAGQQVGERPQRTLDITLRRETIGLLDERRNVLRQLMEDGVVEGSERNPRLSRYAELCEAIAIQVELSRRAAVERASEEAA